MKQGKELISLIKVLYVNSYLIYLDIYRLCFGILILILSIGGKYKKAVVKRVLQRGSKDENDEIMRFYNLSIDELQKYQPKDTREHKLSENNEE